MTKNIIKSSALTQYGMLAAPVAFAGFPLYVLAPDFYAAAHGTSLTFLGLVLLAIRLFDAFQDPLIGSFSDKYRRHTPSIIVSSAIILCISIYGLFNQVYFSPIIWFALCMSLAVTAYSILSINLYSLGVLWTDDTNQQTRIAASREIFALLGLVTAVTLPSLLAENVPQDNVYIWFSLALIFITLVSLFFFFKWYFNMPKRPYLKKADSFFVAIKTLSSDSKKLLLVYLISMFASSIPAVLVIFFVRDLLGNEKYTGLFLLLYFLSGAIFMPFWKRISISHGKYLTWLYSMILAVASFIWAFTLKEGDILQYTIICIASGIALGADLIFPPSILADNVHIAKSENNTSINYAILTLAAKSSLALASVTALPFLESVGFAPNSQNDESALNGLSTAYALIPCILKCLAGFMLWKLFIHNQKGENYGKNQINHNSYRSRHNVK